MSGRIIVNAGASNSSSAHTLSSTSGTSATLTSGGEAEWSKEEDEMCWFMIRNLEHFAPNGQWPSAGVWRARYSLSNVATPPQGRTESELRRRCITLVDQRHAQRLAEAQAKGDGSFSAVAQQPKSPAPQLNVTLPKKSQAVEHAEDAGQDTSEGEEESKEEATSKERSEANSNK